MAKIIMKEYTLGVNVCYSVSFTSKVLFPALSNTLSLPKSSFENIIVHSFGENKSVSSTKALVQIHITVQLELQNAFQANACNTGQYLHSTEKRKQCESNINRFVLLCIIINKTSWLSQVYLTLSSCFLYLVTDTSIIINKCMAMTTQQGNTVDCGRDTRN